MQVPSSGSFKQRLARRRVILCVGPGGVGKTTCAAALAFSQAATGRRVVVVTVDPSKRLAQALGLSADELSAPTGDPVPVLRGEGHLDALVLDGARVFDTIVRSCASGPEGAATILESPFYKATAQRLSGALEYAAMARVQMLHDAGEYDVIVLDTPPTANAIDFIEAPKRVAELVDNPAAKVLSGTGRIGMKLFDLGRGTLTRALEGLGGAGFLSELGDFLREFAAVLQEFQRRGTDFDALLASERTGVVLVSTASPFSVREAKEFLHGLRSRRLHIDGVILNRVAPTLPPPPAREAIAEAARALLEAGEPEHLDQWMELYADLQAHGEQAEAAIEALRAEDHSLSLCVLPRFAQPPHEREALAALGRRIVGDSATADG